MRGEEEKKREREIKTEIGGEGQRGGGKVRENNKEEERRI